MRVAALSLCLALSAVALSTAQAPVHARNEITVHAEPIAAGVRYARAIGARTFGGPALTAGPFHGLAIDGAEGADLREVATLHLAIVVAPTERVRVVLQPVGVALVTGDDFGAAYPSAQGGMEWRLGRFVAGTDVRVIRVAGPNGSADYRIHWIPLRVGRTWAW